MQNSDSCRYISLFFCRRPSEDAEFVMFGNSNCKFNCFAVCDVEGGPEYKIALTGEASTVSYSLDKSYLDFGKIVYTVRHFIC
jgi:hypothetical protein